MYRSSLSERILCVVNASTCPSTAVKRALLNSWLLLVHSQLRNLKILLVNIHRQTSCTYVKSVGVHDQYCEEDNYRFLA